MIGVYYTIGFVPLFFDTDILNRIEKLHNLW